ncbi:MAG: class I SAM-dependent methyltransferase [Halieaceae bacterium]|jgi:SAM-dependent methyltransferase|nr:class I SAM-dependent methyltransferase [Halieaceae bacterium]
MPLEFNEICTRLESWYASPRGRYLFELEKRMLRQQLDGIYGYHQLQIGVVRDHSLAEGSQLSHKIYASPTAGGKVGLVSEADYLPFASESIDVVIIHHALEFAERPHALLREVHRVVAPQGRIVIVAFNPLSLFGMALQLNRLLPDRLWSAARQLTAHRLKDWLNLLGAEVEPVQHALVTPPAGRGRLFRGLSYLDGLAMRYNLPAGGVYTINAQKRVSTLTPMRMRWRPQMGGRLIGLAVPQSAAGSRKNRPAP